MRPVFRRLRNSSTATKTDTPVMETPFSIQVVPKQVLEDRQSVRLDKPKKGSWRVLRAVRAEQRQSMDGSQYTHQTGE
ncbi:hypothetical protein ACQE3E_12525 [Methylomonas sp. MED-D]|uniref:hypothetical protein n=1 Tax=unclassified Methylomonas TaxID=2608980 RepID=UPI0028A54A85|nr:hypothetical protein [Methylomonas sp. MV1]MDT4331758.1 hypothetical protein [Methylomonas sp. MV1]